MAATGGALSPIEGSKRVRSLARLPEPNKAGRDRKIHQPPNARRGRAEFNFRLELLSIL